MNNHGSQKAIEEIWSMFRDIAQRSKENEERFKEITKAFKETDEKFKETDKQIKELSNQIGGLGNKFIGFTEGIAFPSMRRILMEKFQMDVISPRVISRRNGKMMELDVLAYAGKQVNVAYIVEVKRRLRIGRPERYFRSLKSFPRIFPLA